MKTEKFKEEISRSMNWVLFAALFFTMLASIIGCSKKEDESCYECRTNVRIDFSDGSARYEGMIKEGEIVCEENPDREDTEKISENGKEGIKYITRRCKTKD
jgi:hypothetical protein